MIKERMSKQDLMDLYGVDRVTIEDWRRNKGLKMMKYPLTQNTSLEKSYYSGKIA